MIYIESEDFPGIEEIINKIEFYKNKLNQESVISFRNANLNYNDQERFVKLLGDALGLFPNSGIGKTESYTENHSTTTPSDKIFTGNDPIISWHIEHPHFNLPIILGIWSMTTFTTDTQNGKTYFVDTSKIYKEIPEDWQNFLSSCVSYAYDYTLTKSMRESKVIQDHWSKDDKVIRFELIRHNKDTHLKTFDNRPPTEKEIDKFKKITTYIYDQIIRNEDIRIVKQWSPGDLLISDLFSLAHTVTGGFKPEEREFTSMWLYNSDNSVDYHYYDDFGR